MTTKTKKQKSLPYAGINNVKKSKTTPIIPDASAGIDFFNNALDVSFNSSDIGAVSMGESYLSESLNIDLLKMNIVTKTIEYMISQGFDEDEASAYTNFDFTDEGDRIKITIGAELSFDALMELAEELDPLIEQYDSDAYFDVATSGIIEAYISTDSSIEESFRRLEKYSLNTDLLGLYEEVNHNLTASQKQELKNFAQKANTAEEVDTFVKGLLSKNDNKQKIGESVEDVIDEPVESTTQPTEEDKSFGASSLLIDLINKKYDEISSINSTIVTLKSVGYDSMIESLESIINEDNNHIGQLQQLIALINPDSMENIEEGHSEVIDTIDKITPITTELDENDFEDISMTESISNAKNIERNKKLIKAEEVNEALVEGVDENSDAYYVSYYEEFPVEKPDGGYSKICELIDYDECSSLDEAKDLLKKYIEEDPTMKQITDEFYLDRSKYIGQDRFYIIETELGSEVIE